MLDAFMQLFQKKIPYKSEIPFSPAELSGYMRANRKVLGEVDDWIDEQAFARSFFNYGVPDSIKEVINKPIGDAPTYTDLMTLIADRYLGSVNYLEIGISVGKNFFQLLKTLPQASLTAFDIEEINPVLASRLVAKSKTEWATPSGSVKKNQSSLSEFSFGGKKVSYVSGDVWDANSWARLEGNSFNLVFSDALHSPEAILFEFEMLVKYRLLGERFVIVWDDLVGKMKNSFFRIIRRYNETYGIRDIYLLEVNGWVGQHEGAHSVGIISNFEF
ncbi:MAG TPA: class I SAM-dependent methyltransferase [Puia sp.]|nr:class I SAM-dependent methyltransferase [Puia sp.]